MFLTSSRRKTRETCERAAFEVSCIKQREIERGRGGETDGRTDGKGSARGGRYSQKCQDEREKENATVLGQDDRPYEKALVSFFVQFPLLLLVLPSTFIVASTLPPNPDPAGSSAPIVRPHEASRFPRFCHSHQCRFFYSGSYFTYHARQTTLSHTYACGQ